MANSAIISKIKNKVIKSIVEDDLIVQVIDSPEMNKNGWDSSYLIDSIDTKEQGFAPHIFDYHRDTSIVETAITFVTVQLHMADPIDKNQMWSRARLEITVVSHQDHMRIENIPTVTSNRNDYFSMLIDSKINNLMGVYGKFKLIGNYEGVTNTKFIFRKMTFEGNDLNYSLCEDDE